MKLKLNQCQHAIVWGGGRGIGLALTKVLLDRYPQLKVISTYRSIERASELLALTDIYQDRLQTIMIDPSNEDELKQLAQGIKSDGIKLDLLINSIGVLHNESFQPEKSLRTLNMEQFIESFKINSVLTALIAKHFEILLPRSTPCAFVAVSAKVGSIEDNKMGGWYSYRASKAALNMILKTISIEFHRKRLNCLVMPIHPGTTKTELSKPFTEKTTYKLHTPQETASNIINQIDGRSTEESGDFLSWDGEKLPW